MIRSSDQPVSSTTIEPQTDARSRRAADTNWILENRDRVSVVGHDQAAERPARVGEPPKHRRAGLSVGLVTTAALALAACGGAADSGGAPTTERPDTTTSTTVDQPTTTPSTIVDTPTTDAPTTSVATPSTEIPTTTSPALPPLDVPARTSEALSQVGAWAEVSNRAADTRAVPDASGRLVNPVVDEFAQHLADGALEGFERQFNSLAEFDSQLPFHWNPQNPTVVSVTLENGRAVVVVRDCAVLEVVRDKWDDTNANGLQDLGEVVPAGSYGVTPSALRLTEQASGDLRIDESLTRSGRFLCPIELPADGSKPQPIAIADDQQMPTAGFDPRL